MARERIDVVEDRLKNLERRYDLLEYRLRSVEHWRADGGARSTGDRPVQTPIEPVAPPPMASVETVEPPPVISGGWQQIQQHLETTRPAPNARGEDTEYTIGAKLLPKFGAALVLAAVLYFVAWGYSAGWISPAMVFCGEVIFCFAFIGLGQWKRNEKEQYGQILTGIGSCGLYASLAGGHLVQNLFSGEVLVVSFMTLSLANLAYGLWSHSKSFFAIGLLGGFSAALLPMREHETNLNAILHLAIVAPAALIAVRRKWADMATSLWVASTLALIPLLSASVDWRVQIGTLYFASLAATAAYLNAAGKNRFDSEGLLAPCMLFITGLIGLGIEHDRVGAVHLALLGAGSAAVAFAARAVPVHREKTFVAAIAIPATLAPICFTRVECLSIYIGLSLVAALAGVAGKSRTAASFAGAEFLLAIFSYVTIEGWNPLPGSAEAWLLCGLMVSGVATAYAAIKAGGSAESFTMGSVALLLPLFGRLGVVTLTGSSVSASPEVAAAEALTFFALAAIALTARTRWISAMAAMWVSFGIAGCAYLYAVSFGNVPGIQDAFLVAMLGVTVTVGLPIAMGTAPVDFRKPIATCAGIVTGMIFMRFAYVVALLPRVGFDPILAACLAAAGFSVGASLVAIFRKSDPACAVACAMFTACGVAYLGMPMKASIEMPIVTGLLTAFVAASVALGRHARKSPEIWHAVALLGWVVFSRWVNIALGWNTAGLSSMTIAWIVYALALITVGFTLKAKELRYWSMGVMFATVCKILLVDLSNTSTPFRVGVLLGLGILMLGGGYWYIKGMARGKA